MNEPHSPQHGHRLNPYPDSPEVAIARLEVRMNEADRRAIDAKVGAERAIEKAESALSHRLDLLNELRGMVTDRDIHFASREQVEAKYQAAEVVHDEIKEQIGFLRERFANVEANQRQNRWLITIAIALAPIAIAIAALIVRTA